MTDLNTRATPPQLLRLTPHLVLVLLLALAVAWVALPLQVDAQISAPGLSSGMAITESYAERMVATPEEASSPSLVNPICDKLSVGSDAGFPTSTYTTTAALTGTEGSAGWFVSGVTVTLTIGGTGAAHTHYRLDTQAWLTYTNPFAVRADGVHQLDFYSAVAGSATEPTHTVNISIDVTPPSSAIAYLPAYQPATSFLVAWSANDNAGSGVADFDVQQKDGFFGTWQDWLTNTTALSAKFSVAQRGHVYYFQARARDVAGNIEPYRGGRGDASTFVDSVINGGFETGDFSGWGISGEMSKSIALAGPVGGSGQWGALLGSPDYGSSITPTEALHVPTDTQASIAQIIVVPSLIDMPAPALMLWYHIFTYDVVWGCTHPDQLYDSFDVSIRDVSGTVLGLPLREGNYDCETYTNYYYAHGLTPTLTQIVNLRTIDLSPYAGRKIMIEMHNANRQTWDYNTYTYVDDIHVVNQPVYPYRINLPVIISEPSQSPAPGIQRRAGEPTPRR